MILFPIFSSHSQLSLSIYLFTHGLHNCLNPLSQISFLLEVLFYPSSTLIHTTYFSTSYSSHTMHRSTFFPPSDTFPRSLNTTRNIFFLSLYLLYASLNCKNMILEALPPFKSHLLIYYSQVCLLN